MRGYSNEYKRVPIRSDTYTDADLERIVSLVDRFGPERGQEICELYSGSRTALDQITFPNMICRRTEIGLLAKPKREKNELYEMVAGLLFPKYIASLDSRDKKWHMSCWRQSGLEAALDYTEKYTSRKIRKRKRIGKRPIFSGFNRGWYFMRDDENMAFAEASANYVNANTGIRIPDFGCVDFYEELMDNLGI